MSKSFESDDRLLLTSVSTPLLGENLDHDAEAEVSFSRPLNPWEQEWLQKERAQECFALRPSDGRDPKRWRVPLDQVIYEGDTPSDVAHRLSELTKELEAGGEALRRPQAERADHLSKFAAEVNALLER